MGPVGLKPPLAVLAGRRMTFGRLCPQPDVDCITREDPGQWLFRTPAPLAWCIRRRARQLRCFPGRCLGYSFLTRREARPAMGKTNTMQDREMRRTVTIFLTISFAVVFASVTAAIL